jgi:hypothetical protein
MAERTMLTWSKKAMQAAGTNSVRFTTNRINVGPLESLTSCCELVVGHSSVSRRYAAAQWMLREIPARGTHRD